MTHFVHWAEKAWPGLLEWLAHGNRGLSANAIVDVVCGIPCGRPVAFCLPLDRDDDKRCLSLLRCVPSIVPHLGHMSRMSQDWAAAVERLRLEMEK